YWPSISIPAYAAHLGKTTMRLRNRNGFKITLIYKYYKTLGVFSQYIFLKMPSRAEGVILV
ncbi:MAG: hypothetical protein E6276_08100, partial [Clostridiales bacterium]|nr:hypothetical protein [Clostridiales bacterium]MDU7245326.1 hypothetical protein [Clostridiales bacterium]